MKLVLNMNPTSENRRNSEGDFLRAPDGRILFAYSRYGGEGNGDNCRCDIAMISSADEGDSWSEPQIIAPAAAFGVANVMSVSGMMQSDGTLAFYFLIKENNGGTTIGRALSADGVHFKTERCDCRYIAGYYVINNARFVRLRNGRIAVPAAYIPSEPTTPGRRRYYPISCTVCLLSEDDGMTFDAMPPVLTVPVLNKNGRGMQEPGLIELEDGAIWVWARTAEGAQYQAFSRDGMESFTMPHASRFTAPTSPMEVARDPETGDLYAAYNPVPEISGVPKNAVTWGRTPFVVCRSSNDGRTWSENTVVGSEPERGYCYPAFFFTKDHALLLAHCRGGAEDGSCLDRLGILKISKDEIK